MTIGNPGRRIYLELRGEGRAFRFEDDLLVHEGKIQKAEAVGNDRVRIQADRELLFQGVGNRKATGFTSVNEAGTWHFRAGRVLKRPTGARLGKESFGDENGDGRVHLKTYEVGIGDEIELYTQVTLRRAGAGYQVRTNVPVKVSLGNRRAELEPSEVWQPLK